MSAKCFTSNLGSYQHCRLLLVNHSRKRAFDFISIFLLSAKAENPANHFGYHLFVRAFER